MRIPVIFALTATAVAAFAFQGDPNIVVPNTSIPRAEDRGIRAHTNHLIWVGPPPTRFREPNVPYLTALHGPTLLLQSGPSGYTPDEIRTAYGLPSTGGANAIAIVDAYHYPTARKDFNTFSQQFGLPVETSTVATASTNTVFRVVFASGTKPPVDEGWSQEAALDIEWAHAMAPSAKIYLVEAASSAFTDLFAAVHKAASLKGVREISMSWGGSEFSTETNFDADLNAYHVVYCTSAGDVGGQQNYPATSPNVIAVGGTTLNLDTAGNRVSETGWSGSGGGPSLYEPRPMYQDVIQSIVGIARGNPDIAFDADPSTGCAVYDSTPYLGYSGWLVFGGTSLSSPCIAGCINLHGIYRTSSLNELKTIYAHLGKPAFYDITSGSNGNFLARSGWDYVTGVGTPHGLGGF